MLLRLFERNVLPYSESHYPQYCFLYVCSINQMFLQKLITLFVLRAFNDEDSTKTGLYKADQCLSKVCNINYLCSLLATSGKEIISIRILMESLHFLVKFFKRKFHSKIKPTQFDAESSHSDGNESSSKRVRGKMRIDDKLFYISVVQGLTYILTFKIPEIQSQDPSLLTRILKLVLNNEHKAALYNQTSLLETLIESMKENRINPKYIRRLTKLLKEQKNFLRYKKDLFNRIKRKMPFGTPLFLVECGDFFKNIHSHLPNNQIKESISKNLLPPEQKPATLVKKKVVFAEETKDKEMNFEDKDLQSIFGHPKKAPKTNIRKKIFGKLGRSLSVDFMHKKKASRKSSRDSTNRQTDAQMTTQTMEISKRGDTSFDLEVGTLVEQENLSDGYASDKNTDVASIELLDDRKPILHLRKNRSRNRKRRLNRLQRANMLVSKQTLE